MQGQWRGPVSLLRWQRHGRLGAGTAFAADASSSPEPPKCPPLKCNSCHGSGSVQCSECGGAGRVPTNAANVARVARPPMDIHDELKRNQQYWMKRSQQLREEES